MERDESARILAETRAFAEAMSAGDAAEAAAFCTELGVRVGVFGDTQHGRAEIEAAYERLLHDTMAGARFNQEPGTVRMLTPDLAVWRGGIEIALPGAAAPIRGHAVQMMQRVGERWLILEGHPRIFPTPPAQT